MLDETLPMNERFERAVVFRLARWLPLGLGGVAIIGLVISVLLVIYSFRPTATVADPVPMAQPAPVVLTLEDLKQDLATEKASNSSGNAKPVDTVADIDPLVTPLGKSAVRFVEEFGNFRTLVLGRGLAFTDIVGKKCVLEYAGTCYREEEKVVKTGVAPQILELLTMYETDPDATLVELVIPGSELSLKVRLDPALDSKTAMLKELNGLLKKVAPPDTARYLQRWVTVRTERELALRKAHAEKVELQKLQHSMAVEARFEAEAEKKAMRSTMLMGAAGAFLILLFSGLALAIIAIERHARAIQSLIPRITKSVEVPEAETLARTVG